MKPGQSDCNRSDPIQIRVRTLELFANANVPFSEYTHDPVLSYEDAANVRRQFKLSGVESKNLFLKLKDGRYCMFVTLETCRVDFKLLKSRLGSRLSMGTDEELATQTGCIPRCACPFGLPAHVILALDCRIFSATKFLFSPGLPEKTIEINTSDVRKLIAVVANPVVIV